MREVVDFLKKSQVQYLATLGADGKSKVRPFQFMLEEGGKLYFCTSNQKTVFEELKSRPFVEFCASGENFSWLRLHGKVAFSKDLSIKAKVLEASPLVKSIYKEAANPVFEVFAVEDAEAVFYDFSGNPPKTVRL